MAISRNVQEVVSGHFVGGVEQPYILHLRELAERYDNNPDDVSSQEYNLLVSLKNMEISDNKLAKALENNSVTERDISRNEERHQKFLERYNQYLENSASKVSLPPLTEQGLKSLLESPTEPKPTKAPPLPPEPQVGPVDAPPLPPEVPAKHEAEVAPSIPAMPNELKMAKMEKELDNLANLDTPIPNNEKSTPEPDLADPIAVLRGTGYERLPERTRVAPSPYAAIPASSADFKTTEMAPGTQPIGAENNYGFMPNSPTPAGENQRPENSAYGKVPENARPENAGYATVPASSDNSKTKSAYSNMAKISDHFAYQTMPLGDNKRPDSPGYGIVPDNTRPADPGYTAVPMTNYTSMPEAPIYQTMPSGTTGPTNQLPESPAYGRVPDNARPTANSTYTAVPTTNYTSMPTGPEEVVQRLQTATNYSPIPAADANTAEPVGPSPTNDASMTAANEGVASHYKTMQQPEPVYAQIQLAAVTEPDADLGPAAISSGYQSMSQAKPAYQELHLQTPEYAQIQLAAETEPDADLGPAPFTAGYQSTPQVPGYGRIPQPVTAYAELELKTEPAPTSITPYQTAPKDNTTVTTSYAAMPGQEGPKPEPSMVEPKDDFDPLTTRALDAAVEQKLSEQNDLPSFDKMNQEMDAVNLDKKFPVKEIPAQPNFNTVGEMAAQQERLESNKTNEMQKSSTQSPAPNH